MKKPGKTAGRVIRILLTLVVLFLIYWFTLPPLNFRSGEFWSFLVTVIIVVLVINGFSKLMEFLRNLPHMEHRKGGDRGVTVVKTKKERTTSLFVKISLALAGVIIAVAVVASIVGSQLFNSRSYNQLLTLNDGDFATDIAELSMDQIPVVDRDTSEQLGQRKLGEMSDLVSQFTIESDYTQINYQGRPVRVTPLAYGDVIKWLGNQSEGIPAYISVDMTTQETTLVRLNEGIRYSRSEYFLRNLDRCLRFKYPAKIFDNISFEVDESGTPYWVASTVEYRIALWNGRDIGGAVLLNAVTGESQYYDLEDIPTWVDQVYDSSMVLEQLNYNGKYRSGFFNSVFGQKGVLKPTDGYNYIAVNDDVWLYTGMTSVMSDESNVGFVLINLRTKESKYYSVPGAEEYSAMGSAEGQVQNLKYTSTFPLLLNVSDRPTYFMSLKDGAGLVKMYAFVDVQSYQIVGTGASVDEARRNYIAKLYDNGAAQAETSESTITGTVEAVSTAVVGGNTKYYLRLADNPEIYTLDIGLSDRLPFVGAGDSVTLTVTTTDGTVEITGFTPGE